jgi:hypothetical protein
MSHQAFVGRSWDNRDVTPVKIFEVPPHWLRIRDSDPSVLVIMVHSYVDRTGNLTKAKAHRLIRVPVDQAANLADEAIAWVQAVAGDMHGPSEWTIGAVGFTEHEAMAAYEMAMNQALAS